MARTVFAPGVVINSQWLNGSQNIQFDNLDEDWHYPKLTLDSLNTSSLNTAYLGLSGDQTIKGIKTFSVVPQSTGVAENPNDVLTLKDITSEGRNFLQVQCPTPVEGSMLVYNGEEKVWQCSTVINGGTY